MKRTRHYPCTSLRPFPLGVLIAVFFTAAPGLGQTQDLQQAKALSNAFATVAEKAMPAVVSIKVESK